MTTLDIEALLNKALPREREWLLAQISPDRLVDFVLDQDAPSSHRSACVRSLSGRVPANRVPELFDQLRFGSLCSGLSELLTEHEGPHTPELLSWLQQKTPAAQVSPNVEVQWLALRARLSDATAIDRLVILAADPGWCRIPAERALDALLETHGLPALFGVQSSETLMRYGGTAAERQLGVRLHNRAGGHLFPALGDAARTVARKAYDLLLERGAPQLGRYKISTDPLVHIAVERRPGYVWALALLSARGHDIAAYGLAVPRIELPGVPADVREAIVRHYAPGESDTDPRWILEAALLAPTPHRESPVQRAMAALRAAGVQPATPIPVGDESGLLHGSFATIETDVGKISVSTLGPFFRAEDSRAIAAMTGFRHIDPAAGATVFDGLSVYWFGKRQHLRVAQLLFYWHD